MANLSRFNPFKDLMRQPGMGSLDEFFENQADWPMLRGLQGPPRIKMDVIERDNAFEVRADVPGAKKEDIKVEIDDDVVTISFEVKREDERKEGERVVQSERYVGRAQRSFSVGAEIDEDKATARYDNGVLELKLPVRAGTSGKRGIQIQ